MPNLRRIGRVDIEEQTERFTPQHFYILVKIKSVVKTAFVDPL